MAIMIQLIASIIFFVSLATLGVVLYRKMPVLVTLPKNGHHGFKKPGFVAKLEQQIKAHHFAIFEKKVPLHKFLSKAKVWILRIETKIDHMLHGIRKNAQE